jgi:hypothetical protein
MTEVLLTIVGIVVPSLIVALAVRRWAERVPWRVVFLCLALVFVFTARGVFTRDMPVPLDEVVRGYPYKGVFGEVKAKNSLANDTVKQILPWMQTVRESFRNRRAPLWNPYLFSGYPLLANGQSAPFSPVFLATLFVPLPKQIVAMAGLKLFLALLFGFLFIKRENVSDAAAMFGSVVFAFAVFNNAFLYYPMTAVTLLLPAAAYSVLLALRRGGAVPMLMVAFVVASLMAGGHPESVVHAAMAVLTLVAIERVAPQWEGHPFRWRDFMRVTIAALLGVAVAAPSWVPVLEQVLVSLRMLAIETSPPWGPFPTNTLWAMLNPDGYGNPAHGNYGWILSYTHVASVYLGLIATVLLLPSLLSVRAVKRDRLLIAATIVFFLIGMYWTFLGKLFATVPPLSWIAHDRLRFVVCFFVGIIAARTVSRLRNHDLFWSGIATLITLPLAVYVFVKMYGLTLTPISLSGVVALILFWVAVAFRRSQAAFFAFLLTAVELFIFTFDYNAITDRRFFAPRLPIVDALKSFAAAAPPEPFRVLGLDWVLLPNAAAQYGVEDVRGSDPMEWSDYVRFFRIAELRDEAIDVKRIVDPAHIAIDFLNVRYLLTEPGFNVGGKWQKLYSGRDGELYENNNFVARFFVPKLLRRVKAAEWERELNRDDFLETPLVHGKGLDPVVVNPAGVTVTCKSVSPTEFRIRVTAPERTLVASSQPAMPWWDVRINGRPAPILKVNGAFIGFYAPAGVSDVRVKYRPLPYYASLGVSALALLILGGYAWMLQKRWNRVVGGGVVHGPATGL